MLTTFAILAACFSAIWLGAGLVVKNVEGLARNIHISRFVVSLFLLGIATSVPEFSVAVNSLFYARPQVSIGNLMGASMFLLLVVIPFISFLGGNTSLNKMLPPRALVVFIVVMIVPLAAALDGLISATEGIILILIYLVYMQSRSKGLINNFVNKYGIKTEIKNIGFSILRIIIGIIIIFVASNIVVQKVIELSADLGVSAFLLSIIVISMGTNIPEFSIAVRSVIAGRKDIAIGNYIGSAAANVPIMGLVTILNGPAGVTLSNVATPILVIFIIGVLLFYKACRSGESLTRKEAAVLIALYVGFIFLEGSRELLQ